MRPSAKPELPGTFLDARPGAAGRHADGGDENGRTWVYRHVLAAIRAGDLAAGARLPSSRQLSAQWGVARSAIDDALSRLQREGLLDRRVGRGSFVARRLPPGLAGAGGGIVAGTDSALRDLAPLLKAAAGGERAAPRRWLNPRTAEVGRFPLAVWRRLLLQVHAEPDRASLAYAPAAGLAELREATARHLALTRAIECSPDQVLILNGHLQALDLCARVLLEAGDTAAVESPGYISIARPMALGQLALRGIGIDADGFDVAQLRRDADDAALVYLHPLNQYPTGIATTPARRRELLEWARQRQAWIFEGDHAGEYLHEGAMPPPLFAMDGGQRVVFHGTFNGLTYPALRMTYLVVPERLVPAFTAVRGLMGDHPAAGPQQVMARFLAEGHAAAHVRVLRGFYRARRDAVLRAIAMHLPAAVTAGPLGGGLHGCLHLPAGVDDVALVRALADEGFGVEPLSTYSWPGPGAPGLVYGFGAEDERSIDQAFERLGSLLRAAIGAEVAPASRPAGAAGAPGAAASH